MSREEIKRSEILRMANEKRITQNQSAKWVQNHGILDGYYDGIESEGQKGSSQGIEVNSEITTCQGRKKDYRKNEC